LVPLRHLFRLLPADSPLIQLPNALLTLHLGFVAEPVSQRFVSGMGECLTVWLSS
jgi:phosphoglycerate dehydrogenase-like enzyme